MDKKTLSDIAWDALKYVGDVTSNAICPFCSNATWAYGKTDEGVPRLAWLAFEHKSTETRLPMLPLTCEKCGFTRFHDLAMINSLSGSEDEQS
ncbi:hypothetical protein DEM27_05660 [Metarhizobium album]|uniref:Uncharacterized protein n=1 Tax=Metarhizobium album TaxID=2182425 RepID=A0A2U2DUY7_9HYPH|nr:hypothetical protein [Rhizobium album]PWE57128.1 hypothetical protein DEM27_05660 [Rhizobium album]